MKHGVPLLLVAACAAIVVALAALWSPLRPGRAAPGGEVWRYLFPVPATRAGRTGGAAEPAGVAHCLWPRAVNGDATGAARNEALESNIGLAFCLRMPDAAAPSKAAGGPPRLAYRT